MNAVININEKLNAFAWGPVMLVLFVGTGVFLSFRTGFVQFTRFRYMMRNTAGALFRDKNSADGKNLTPFQAMTTALAGTVGTGNIAGVTGAIFTGGPGAVFWMWVSAFFGMCTKYAEIALAVKYRRVDGEGRNLGGPMYYIESGLGKEWRWLALIFSLFGGLASFGIGNMAQSSEIAGAMTELFNVDKHVTGLCLALLVGFVVIGGVKRIGSFTAFLVPFMSLFFMLAGLYIIIVRFADIPAMLRLIAKSAFSFRSVGGGLFGYAIMRSVRQGVACGVFSNEAGLGSAPIVHAASSTDEPCEQAMWGVFEVFMDTIVICSITAITVLLSGILDTPGGLDAFPSRGAAAAAAFNAIIHRSFGGTIIQISIIFFAVSSIISWCYYGERCWAYLAHENKAAILVYKFFFVFACFAGATGSGTLVWDISDTLNGFMAIPNLIALLLMSGTVARLTKEYFHKL